TVTEISMYPQVPAFLLIQDRTQLLTDLRLHTKLLFQLPCQRSRFALSRFYLAAWTLPYTVGMSAPATTDEHLAIADQHAADHFHLFHTHHLPLFHYKSFLGDAHQ